MSQTLVIKVGTSSLTRGDGRLALATIAALIETIVDLRAQGYQIVLVSSGAVGVGAARLGMFTILIEPIVSEDSSFSFNLLRRIEFAIARVLGVSFTTTK